MGSFTVTTLAPIAISQCFSRMVQVSVYTGHKECVQRKVLASQYTQIEWRSRTLLCMSIEVKWKAPCLKTLTQRAKETKDESSEKRHTEALISVGKFILKVLVKYTRARRDLWQFEIQCSYMKHFASTSIYHKCICLEGIYVIHNTPGSNRCSSAVPKSCC